MALEWIIYLLTFEKWSVCGLRKYVIFSHYNWNLSIQHKEGINEFALIGNGFSNMVWPSNYHSQFPVNFKLEKKIISTFPWKKCSPDSFTVLKKCPEVCLFLFWVLPVDLNKETNYLYHVVCLAFFHYSRWSNFIIIKPDGYMHNCFFQVMENHY